MNKKYTASELVSQAFKLADLNNTAFISHDECMDYLQASFTEVYNDIIQHGDKQFIREVTLHPANVVNNYVEYELPFDFYILFSLKDPISGTLINRQTKSNSINSGNYEIVNNRLRVYGGYTGVQGLTLTYWISPLYITYPDKKISPDEEVVGTILDTVNNSVLSIVEGDPIDDVPTATLYVRNVTTGEDLASISIEEDYNNIDYYLGNGHIVKVVDNTEIQYISFDGKLIYTYESTITPIIGKDFNGNIYFTDNSNLIRLMNKVIGTEVNKPFIILQNKEIVQYDYDKIYYKDAEISLRGISKIMPRRDLFDGRKSALAIIEEEPCLMLFDDDGSVMVEALDHIQALEVLYPIQYGFITSNGTSISIESGIPDTELNFPNEVFYQLIAANLGVRFLMKQNADATGLNSIYDNMLSTFYKSLGQDGAYNVVAQVL